MKNEHTSIQPHGHHLSPPFQLCKLFPTLTCFPHTPQEWGTKKSRLLPSCYLDLPGRARRRWLDVCHLYRSIVLERGRTKLIHGSCAISHVWDTGAADWLISFPYEEVPCSPIFTSQPNHLGDPIEIFAQSEFDIGDNCNNIHGSTLHMHRVHRTWS